MLDDSTEYQEFDDDQDVEEVQEASTGVNRGSPKYIANKSPEPILFVLDEVDEICRICLNPGTIPIFGDEGSNIVSDLMFFANIEVTPDDGLPHNLCTQCQELLEAAIIFRNIAQKSDHILRRKTDEGDCDIQFPSPNIIHNQDNEETTKLSDEDNSEIGVYLEYAETVNESENRSTTSDLEESNASINDNSSIQESNEPDHDELKQLFESFKKKARFPQCEVCNLVFRTAEQLTEHSSDHDPKVIVICEVCKNIIQKDLYNIHLKLHKEDFNQRLEKKGKIECTVCRKFVSKYYMKKHMMLHGTDEEKADRFKKCTVCNKLIHKAYLTEHMIRAHMQSKEPQDKSTIKVKCPICSHMYSESTYKNHVASHGTNRKKYFCEKCGKEFHSQSSFATHTLTHKEEYKFKCQFCPYRGKHLGLLKVHVRTHTKDYAYKCTICGANFITKSNLNAHEKTHSPGVKFVCSECGKSFTTERSLRAHMRSLHEGIKAFPCDICGKRYGRRQVMLAHKKRVHNVFSISRIGKKPSYLLGTQENNIVEDVS